jgi:hypothetical protein
LPADFNAVPLLATDLPALPLRAAPADFDAAPLEAVPFDAVPLEAVPFDAAPLEAAPLDAVPFEAVPFEAAPPRAPAALFEADFEAAPLLREAVALLAAPPREAADPDPEAPPVPLDGAEDFLLAADFDAAPPRPFEVAIMNGWKL